MKDSERMPDSRFINTPAKGEWKVCSYSRKGMVREPFEEAIGINPSLGGSI